jgi:restriction system protein
MKFRMAKNSLFAVLLRSPWWVSALVAAAVFGALRLMLPGVYAFFGALPFIGIAGYAGWLQLRAPSAARVAETLGAIRSMSWDEFSAAIEEALRGEGYRVGRLSGSDAEFELTRAGRVALVGCKRWKVARTGVEPLRELHAATRAHQAHDCIYIAAGDFTDHARAFALEKNIRLVHDAELAMLLAGAARAARRPA